MKVVTFQFGVVVLNIFSLPWKFKFSISHLHFAVQIKAVCIVGQIVGVLARVCA